MTSSVKLALCVMMFFVGSLATWAEASAGEASGVARWKFKPREAVVQRVRAELATLLKKEAPSLSVDKSVLELGADELDVVEWVMAVEEAFQVQIPDDKIVDPKSKKTLKDLSIASLARVVSDTLASTKSKPK